MTPKPTDARAAIDAETDFVGTVAPEGADKLDAAKLTAWMDANVEGFHGPIEVSKFKGGQSNPTYKIESPSGRYVLRRKPFGPLLPLGARGRPRVQGPGRAL